MKEVSLVAACDGNISYRRADGTIIITPSGVPKGEIKKKRLATCYRCRYTNRGKRKTVF